jgi:uncharacterized protein
MAESNGQQSSRFAIEVGPGEYLVYAPLSDWLALVSAPSADAAMRTVVDRPAREAPTSRSGALSPDFLVLLPTRGCNIACTYCDFAHGTDDFERLSLDVGVAAIEWFARRQAERGQAELPIHFFGGEPFFAWQEVVALCGAARMRANKHGLRARFQASSNGVYSEAKARWVADNFDTVMLSFDGDAADHDRLRANRKGKGTFDTVWRTAEIFRDGAVDLYLRCCVTQQTVDKMPEFAQRMARQLAPAAISFEPIKPSPETDAMGASVPEPLDFARRFAESKQLLEAHGIQVVLSSVRTDMLHASFCPVGNDGMVVWPDGTVASCYLTKESWAARGLDLRYGQFNPGGLSFDERALDTSRALVVDNKPRCSSCYAKWHCAGGCHVDHTPPGSDAQFDEVCIQTRVLTVWDLLRQLGAHDAAARWLANPRWEASAP